MRRNPPFASDCRTAGYDTNDASNPPYVLAAFVLLASQRKGGLAQRNPPFGGRPRMAGYGAKCAPNPPYR